MKFRNSVLALSLITAVSGFALQASAQGSVSPALSFYPAGGWSAGGQAGQSCVIQSTYNNGFVVSFGGLDQNIDRLNINFQQDAFEAGKSYGVAFRIPGSAPRMLQGTASAANTLSINVGGNAGLMESLRGASAFDITVEGNDFRFYLTGFASGAKGFDECMGTSPPPPGAGIKQVTVAPDTGKAPPPPPVDPDAPFDADAPQLVPVTEILPEDKQAATPLIVPQGERMSEKLAAQIEKNPEIAEIDNTPVKMRETESDALKPDDKIEFNSPPPGKTAPITPVLAEPQKITNKKSPEPIFHREVQTRRVDLTKYDDIEPATDAPFSRTKSDPEMLRKISELESTIQKLKHENTALSSDLQSNVRETEEERISISSDNWNLERATMRYNEAERELKRMGQQLQQERAQCTMQKQDLEAQLFDPQVTSQQQLAKLADLEGKLAEAKQKADTDRLHYEERIRMLEGAKATQ